MSDLIERLRERAKEAARETAASGITCPDAVKHDGRNWDRGSWCGEVHDGHRCRWSGAPHTGYAHRCFCGTYWGRGAKS